MPLTVEGINALKPAEKLYRVADSNGLCLEVAPTGSKLWRYRYRFDGKGKMLALGGYPAVTLKQARKCRDEARALLSRGVDPVEQARQNKADAAMARVNTFEALARDWHTICAVRWSPDHAGKVLRRMESHLFPIIGTRPLADLKARDLLAPLKAVEDRDALETASRLRQYMAGVMRLAVQRGIIDHNPASDLQGATATRKATHRPALPLERLPDLLGRLNAYNGRLLTRYAVQLTLLVFIRSSELRFARWDEIDFDRALWTIPGEREAIEGVKYSTRGAKMGTPHLVPLSSQALALLEQVRQLTGSFALIFPGDHYHVKPMSENTVNAALRRMGYDTKADVCGHGFRAMACSSLVESGLWSRDAVERQMSHQERNGVRAAYIHKAEHIRERRLMVQWWADYLDANRQQHIQPFDFANAGAGTANVASIKRA